MTTTHRGSYSKVFFLCLAFIWVSESSAAEHQTLARGPSALAEMSLEELGNIEIISVSKRLELLSNAPAAIFVITRDDILRAGAVTIPEALRLAPNLRVARIDSNQYAISARGINSATANQLLVLIDGRSVYTPLYSGVFWDVQDTLLEDIERIEVISGPGGTLWGSNAVNGVINIVTRSAHKTTGKVGLVGAGDEKRTHLGFRVGGELSEKKSYRVYGKYLKQDDTIRANGSSASDAWDKGQLGFRFDWDKAIDQVTVQGDAYKGKIDQATFADKTIEGANLLGRWTRDLGADASVQLQSYFDHTKRDYPGTFEEIRNTIDVELQHRFKTGQRHSIVWGAGYRSSSDHVRNDAALAFLPTHTRLDLSNLFLQDSVTLIQDRLDLTLGVKFEHNDFTGLETQPSARLAWKPHDKQLVWGAISRAVRTPSRIDRHLFVPGSAPFLLTGGPDFRSETLIAYELGYRVQASPRASLSVSTFYNVYDHLRSIEPVPGAGTFIIANEMEGETYGAELWGDLLITDSWRLKAGYAYLNRDLRLSPNSRDPNDVRGAGNDPKHQFLLRSSIDLTPAIDLDWTFRYIDSLPDPAVPSYTALDLRLGWKATKNLEISLVGQNLLDDQHPEFGATPNRSEIERSLLVRAIWRL